MKLSLAYSKDEVALVHPLESSKDVVGKTSSHYIEALELEDFVCLLAPKVD